MLVRRSRFSCRNLKMASRFVRFPAASLSMSSASEDCTVVDLVKQSNCSKNIEDETKVTRNTLKFQLHIDDED
jgi:hypothetical protein